MIMEPRQYSDGSAVTPFATLVRAATPTIRATAASVRRVVSLLALTLATAPSEAGPTHGPPIHQETLRAAYAVEQGIAYARAGTEERATNRTAGVTERATKGMAGTAELATKRTAGTEERARKGTASAPVAHRFEPAATSPVTSVDEEVPERPRRSLAFSWGAMQLAHQDLVHTPFVHGGTSPISFALSYDHAGTRWTHFAEGRYGALASRLGEPYEISHGDHGHDDPPHGFLLFEAAYGVGRTVASGVRHSAAAGASLRVDLQAVFYRYGVHDNFGYFFSPGLNVWYGRFHRLGASHALKGRVEAPVVSWLARSPYMVNDDRFIENIASNDPLTTALAMLAGGEPVTWNRLQRIYAVLEYEYAVSTRIGLGASYRFTFTRSSEPRPLISYQSNLNLTAAVRL